MPDSEPLGDDLVRGQDGVVRCAHRLDEPAYRAHHDAELGRPSADDAWVFEKLVLEVFSTGLSFVTMLRRREALRAAFDGYALRPWPPTTTATSRGCWLPRAWSYEPDPATRPDRVTPAWMHQHPSNPESAAMAHGLKRAGSPSWARWSPTG